MKRLLNRKKLIIYAEGGTHGYQPQHKPKLRSLTVIQSLNVIVRPANGLEFDMTAVKYMVHYLSRHCYEWHKSEPGPMI